MRYGDKAFRGVGRAADGGASELARRRSGFNLGPPRDTQEAEQVIAAADASLNCGLPLPGFHQANPAAPLRFAAFVLPLQVFDLGLTLDGGFF
ncbi:unnamed protein product [Cuscuta campestris]|uniref:Uncharacterized protein n=1 Tax=Cuscuta campestris TaxID=132261 RepID=A0A484MFB0_9ASTE|nr:unnamed protein product [Cuscuta campestris]